MGQLTHQLRIMRLYRQGMREIINWTFERPKAYNRFRQLRWEFEINRYLDDREHVEKLTAHGEMLVQLYAHPIPLKPAHTPVGGVLYGVNNPDPENTRFYPNFKKEAPQPVKGFSEWEE